MTRRRRDPFRTELLIGLAAVVVIAAIGFISFRALSGLPFQRRYHVTVALRDADRLLATNDVRIAGVRVGQVQRVTAEPGRPPYARVDLVLDRSTGRLPADTTVAVRPASVLGATYVELDLGTSRTTVPDGGRLPLARARGTVDVTDLFDTFDRSSRVSFQRGVRGLSDGLAGRGRGLNATFGSVAHLLGPLGRVMAAVREPVGPFVAALDRFSSELDPIAVRDFVSGAATTFAALGDERAALGDAIAVAPGAEQAATNALVRVRPGLDALARLSRDLRGAGRLLPAAAARAAATLDAGVAPLRALPRLTGPLRTTFATLRGVSLRPSTAGALRTLAPLLSHSEAFVRKLGPAQEQCNAISLGTQGFASFSGMIGTGDGPTFWNLAVSTKGAQTDGYQAAEQAPDLKVNYLPNNDRGECESGNEPAASGQKVVSNPAGLQARTTRRTTPPAGTRARAQAAGLIG